MSGPTPAQIERLRSELDKFRNNRWMRFLVKLRRKRAGELRHLLSDPDAVDLDTFNHEVWNASSAILLNGDPVDKLIFGKIAPTDEQLSKLEEALDQGSLKIHGNVIWGAGAHVFGAQDKSSKEAKAALIRQALRILIEPSSNLLQKTREMEKIKGFGRNITTGLVMMFHPETFCLYNKRSERWLSELGYDVKPLEQFEQSAESLRRALELEDFLEQDSFLDNLVTNSPEVWKSIVHPPPPNGIVHPPTLDELVAATNLARVDVDQLLALIEWKKQIILDGPPGSGKTYIADLLGRYLTDNPLVGPTDDSFALVQFHQSYGYEDFVQGIRPETNAGGQLEYRVRGGIFKEFCTIAARNLERKFVILIDEINRANISRVFGELLLLLEYRDKEARLAYSRPGEPLFSIPANVYVIGTMNNVDRSLTTVDYALRRRFYFYRLQPVVDGKAPVLEKWLKNHDIPPEDQKRILGDFIALNQRIAGIAGEDFQVGHSYFMDEHIADPAVLQRIWQYTIRPLLEEYFYNHRDRAKLLAELRPASLSAPTEEVPDS